MDDWTTINGYRFDECVSALQKCIRAALEYEACFFAWELVDSGYDRHVWKRLSIIAVEDVGLADPSAIAVVNACRQTWNDYRKHEPATDHSPARTTFIERNVLAHAVMALCRAEKSREVDDLTYIMDLDRKAGVRLQTTRWIEDGHTQRGKARLREEARQRGEPFLDVWCKEFYEDVARASRPVEVARNPNYERSWMDEVAVRTGCNPAVYRAPLLRERLSTIPSAKPDETIGGESDRGGGQPPDERARPTQGA